MHLTAKQQELYDFIVRYEDENGIIPSYDEMLIGVDLKSKSGINRLIVSLEERGYIARIPNRARAIEIVHPDQASIDPAEHKASRMVDDLNLRARREEKRAERYQEYLRSTRQLGKYKAWCKREQRLRSRSPVLEGV